jgi:hypothetical protein
VTLRRGGHKITKKSSVVLLSFVLEIIKAPRRADSAVRQFWIL